MRRIVSLAAARALFGSLPRILIVAGVLVAYYLASTWVAPFAPWWIITLAGPFVFGGLVYLGSVWLDRDLIRQAEGDPPTDREHAGPTPSP